jgi:hypothetical protein
MNRFTMTLTAAAASALVAGATVALPAIGDDSGGSPAKPVDNNDVSTFAACLSDHGLPGAPTTAVALKEWLGAKEASDPVAAKKAMKACQPADAKPERRELDGPDVQKLVQCMRANGLDAPSDPAALKRWLQQKEASDPDAIKRVIPTCKMQLGPAVANAAKPGVCGDDAGPKPDAKPGDEVPKPEETKPAEPSTSTSTPST